MGAAGEGEDEGDWRESKPEGVVGAERGGPGAERGTGDKGEDDEGEIAKLPAAFPTGRRITLWGDGFEEAIADGTKIAGDVGGVVREVVYGAEARDLVGRDEGDDGGEGHLGKGRGQPGETEEGCDFESEPYSDSARAQSGLQELAGGDAGEKGDGGNDVTDGLLWVVMKKGDAKENTVASHCAGKDMTVVDIDEGIEQTSGEGEKSGGGERVDGSGFRHGAVGLDVREGLGREGKAERRTKNRAERRNKEPDGKTDTGKAGSDTKARQRWRCDGDQVGEVDGEEPGGAAGRAGSGGGEWQSGGAAGASDGGAARG